MRTTMKTKLTITPQLLLAARTARGHTQRRAAIEVGVEANTWARWERGENMPRNRLTLKALQAYCITRVNDKETR